jgi:hypothetical protein
MVEHLTEQQIAEFDFGINFVPHIGHTLSSKRTWEYRFCRQQAYEQNR